uniref:trypsin n=1 Tax=Scleropages formosus TaxID=113540 RepID=A0A8C9R5N9_SCLFO
MGLIPAQSLWSLRVLPVSEWVSSGLKALRPPERLDSGIVNGRAARPHSRPYMASVQQDDNHICGGFLVSESFVMTAAHCSTGKNLTVLLGTQDLRKKQGSVRIRVKFYHFYPGYDDVLLRNDILLLQLEEPARGGTIQKIALPKKDRDVKPKTLCSVAGWGKTKDRGPVQQHLMEANVTAVDRKVCKTAWGARVTANMLCAGGSGDSGGPLVCKNAAEGIVSFFEKGECGSPTKPNVYTQVSRYLPWIKSIMKSI